ncbi:MAG TPA: universal stress protein, partial [Gaiellaceae bacterium]|nr:universal stress protein [Gaiellaceae bacterium]
PHHELEAWKEEFLARHAPRPEDVRLEVRVGRPGESVLRVAEEADADLIALGWARDLSRGRAAVVREVLERSPIPVLLVSVTPAGIAQRLRTASGAAV